MIEMMIKVAAVAVTAAVLSAVLRKNTPELALLLVLSAGIWMLGLTVNAMGAALELLRELTGMSGVEEELLLPVAKTVALSLVTRMTAEICRGAGESGIAAFVETTGTVLALGVSLPMVRAVMILMGELLG